MFTLPNNVLWKISVPTLQLIVGAKIGLTPEHQRQTGFTYEPPTYGLISFKQRWWVIQTSFIISVTRLKGTGWVNRIPVVTLSTWCRKIGIENGCAFLRIQGGKLSVQNTQWRGHKILITTVIQLYQLLRIMVIIEKIVKITRQIGVRLTNKCVNTVHGTANNALAGLKEWGG